jgi:hypothetical protein
LSQSVSDSSKDSNNSTRAKATRTVRCPSPRSPCRQDSSVFLSIVADAVAGFDARLSSAARTRSSATFARSSPRSSYSWSCSTPECSCLCSRIDFSGEVATVAAWRAAAHATSACAAASSTVRDPMSACLASV